MKRYFINAMALLAISGLAVAGGGDESSHMKSGMSSSETITLTGQIIDPVCFVGHDLSGPDHRSCAMACANMGINLAFYNDQDHQIYMIFPTGHANPNDKVVDFAESRVEITGTIHKKAGYQAIEIETIKPLGEGKKIVVNE